MTTTGPPRIEQQCVLCQAHPSTRQGEHVWPAWYLSRLDRDPDTYPLLFPQWTRNGVPIVDRHGDPVRTNARMRVQIAVCRSCNTALADRFETPTTRAALEQVFATDGAVALDQPTARHVGEWLAKTLLLLARPEITYSHPRVDAQAVRLTPEETPPKAFYEWLTDASPPPDGLSLWVHRADLTRQDPPEFRMPLPAVTGDGKAVEYVSLQVAMHGLSVTLVVHPGWRIVHPLEQRGDAVRLVPAPTATIDLTTLPVLWPSTVVWMRRRVDLKPGALGSDLLPLLRWTEDPLELVNELWPFMVSWGA